MEFVFDNYKYEVANPAVCPHCHNGVEPRFLSHESGYTGIHSGVNYSIWKCTHRDCGKIFVAVYGLHGFGQYDFGGFLDGSLVPPHWPETIKSLESKFIDTYMQAMQAENLRLDEISGMGYRKAIEYLVKDYLISKDANLKGKIEDQLLAKIIGENFNDSRESDLKELLQRATWLGNDMTHYLKYHQNFDIDDLKELIKLVMDEIHSIEQKRHYITNIQSKFKS